MDELRARVLGFIKYQQRKSFLNELFHSAEDHEKAPNRIRTQEAKRLIKQAWQMEEQQANENGMDQSQWRNSSAPSIAQTSRRRGHTEADCLLLSFAVACSEHTGWVSPLAWLLHTYWLSRNENVAELQQRVKSFIDAGRKKLLQQMFDALDDQNRGQFEAQSKESQGGGLSTLLSSHLLIFAVPSLLFFTLPRCHPPCAGVVSTEQLEKLASLNPLASIGARDKLRRSRS
jgi:hypothetical protein